MRLTIRGHILVVVSCHLICILDGEAILVSGTEEEHIPILQGDAKVCLLYTSQVTPIALDDPATSLVASIAVGTLRLCACLLYTSRCV